MGKSMTRRKFCIGTAVLGGTVALAGCSAPTASNTASPDIAETDILIIGAGLAGTACARAAAEGGANVILVDKAPTIGSTFSTSKGNVSICQIEENEEYWQFADTEMDTMDAFIKRYTAATETGKIDVPWPDYDRVKTIMTESCKTVAWAEELGVDFVKSLTKEQVGTDTVWPDTANNPEIVGGSLYNEKMLPKLEELGVEIKLTTGATSLVAEDDVIIGAKLDDGSEIHAKAVVLATGGFGASQEYCDQLVPAINEMGFQYHGNPMNTGDGMTMAKEIGAATYEDGWIIPNVISPARALTAIDPDFNSVCSPSHFGASLEGAQTTTKILVNAEGSRFVNEAAPDIAQATAMTDLAEGPYYVLFDSSNDQLTGLFEKALNSGSLFKGETIEELAETAGCTKLAETFAAYQNAAKSGEDALGKQKESIVAYQDGPFYLVEYVPSYVATMGGVRTNADCQAIRDDNSVVEGLYVIGEATHRFMYNRSFVRHCSNQSAMTMGRMTGTALAGALNV